MPRVVPPTPKPRDNRARRVSKAERYDEILAAATTVFAEQGEELSRLFHRGILRRDEDAAAERR